MKKKFTMLLAALLCCVGVAKADFTQTYTKTGEFWTAVGTEYPAGLNNTTDAGGGKGNASEHVGVDGHSVYKAEMNITANGGDITVTFAYVADQGLGTNSHAASFLGVDLLKDGNVVYQDYHLSFVGGIPQSNVYTLTGVESGDYTLRYFICDKAGDHAIIATGGTITVTGAELPIVASTAENKIFYHIKNVRSRKYANYEGAGVQFTQVETPALGSYWYLLEVADAEDVPEGYKAYYLYNAGNMLAVENPTNGYMSAPDADPNTDYPAKVYCIGEHTNGEYTGVVIRPLKEDGSSWNDAGGNGTKIGTYSYDDPGSIWTFERADITESQLVQNAVAIKTGALNNIATEVTNTHRYFYGYELSDLDAKNAEIEAIAVPENSLADAVTGAITISKMSLFAGLERIAPKAGDKFTMVNRERNSGKDGLVAFAAGTDVKCLQAPLAYFDALWTLVAADDEGQFKLYNEKMDVYVGVLSDADETKFQYVAEAESAGVYELANVDGYATFKKVGGDAYSHLHQSGWGGKELVRWEKQAGASQWQLAKTFGPELTTDVDNPICYALKSGRDKKDEKYYYYTLDANKVKLYNNKTIATDETTHWYFMLDESGNLKMYSKSDNNAMGYLTGTDGNTKLTNNETASDYDNNTYVLYFAPYNQNYYNDAWFALKPSRNDTYVSNHGGTGNYMGFYDNFNDAGTRIAFESVDGMKLAAKIAECEAKVVKEAIGYYSVSGGDAVAVLAAAKEALQSNDNAAYRSSLAALEALTYTPNIPEVGKYYRIKGKTSGNYIDAAGQNNAQMNMKATPDPLGSIFFLDEGNRLKNMSTGTYVHNTHSIGATKENANTWEFILSSIGYLKLKANSGSVWLHDSSNKANRCQNDDENHEFIVEEVTLDELNGLYLNGCTYITTLSGNSNHPVIVNNARSNWAVADKAVALNTLDKLGLEKNAADTKQQFAFITPDGGENYYLYSVHAKRYLKSDNTFSTQGEPIAFADASAQGANKVQVRFKDIADKYINVGGSNQMTIDWWNTIDVGNACELVQCNTLTFDLEEALDIFNNGADITLTCKVGDIQYTTTTYMNKGETFTLPSYAFSTITSCKLGETDLEAGEDGIYSFIVDGDATVTLGIEENLPFVAAKNVNSISSSDWYYLQMHSNNKKYIQYLPDRTYIEWLDAEVKKDSLETYLWAFVGNVVEGFKMVNHAATTGNALKSTGSENPAMAAFAEGTAFVLSASKESQAGGFCMKYPNGNYLNAQGGKVAHWGVNDAGSTFVAIQSPVALLADLTDLIAYADSVVTIENLNEEAETALSTAIATAQGVYDDATEYAVVETGIANLNVAIDEAIKSVVDTRLFRLKNTASGLYMTIVTPEILEGIQIKAKEESAVKQAFYIEHTGAVGKYNIKSTENYFMASSGNWNYGAYAADNEEGRAHEVVYLGNGKYALKTLKGFAGPNKNATAEGSPLYSNHTPDNNGREWELEEVAKSTVTYIYKYGEEVIASEVHENVYEGLPYPAATTTLPFGFTMQDNALIGNKAEGEETKEIACELSLPFEYYDAFDNVEKWYYLKIHATNQNYLYYDVENSTQLDATKKEVDASKKDAYTWAFIGNPITGFKVVNKLSTESSLLYLNATENQPSVADAEHVWTLTDASNYAANGFFMACSTEGAASSYRLNKNNSKGIVVYWDGADGGSTFMVEERDLSGVSELQEYVDEVTPLLEALGDGTATAVGYITVESWNEAKTALETANKAIENKEGIDVAQVALQNAVKNLKTIQPTEGTYYTIQNSYSKVYMNVSGNTGMKTTDSAGIGELFQFVPAADGKFYMYNIERGTYLSTAKAHNGGQNQAGAVEQTSAVAVTITNLGAENHVSIVPEGGATLHHDVNYKTVVAWNGGLNSRSSWQIVEVPTHTDLTRSVTVNQYGYSTLYLNYPVVVPEIEGEGNGVFVASLVDGDILHMRRVNAGSTISAKTGVVVKANANSSCEFKYSTEVGDTESLFRGTLLNEKITPDENTICYMLGKAVGTEEIGFFPVRLRDDNGNLVEEGGTYFQNSANKIYLPVSKGQNAPSLSFRFGTSEVEHVDATQETETRIYDLMGRRVEKMVEGIYIVNGRKVVIK